MPYRYNPFTGKLDATHHEAINLTDLKDVTVTSGAQYNLLQLNGSSEWVNIVNLDMGSGNIWTEGHGGFGANDGVYTTTVLNVAKTWDHRTGSRIGFSSNCTFSPSDDLTGGSDNVAVAATATWSSANDGETQDATIRGVETSVTATGAGNMHELRGLDTSVGYYGAGNVTDITGSRIYTWGNDASSEAGNLTNMYGVNILAATDKGTGTITNRYGVYIGDVTGGGNLTNNYGVYIAALSGGTTDYGIVINGDGFYDGTGTLTLGGVGNTNNENLTLDFETTANEIALGTGTGVTHLDFGSFNTTTTGWVTNKNFSTSSHYSGFPNTSDTSLSWDDGTYTLTLTASDDKVWIDGVEYNIDSLTKALTAGQEAASDLYWFWITAPGGTPQLNCDSTAPGFDKCLVATVYWNTTTSKGLLMDERHWMGRDQKFHQWAHETMGARYESGFGLTHPTTSTDTQLQVESGEFHDEDLEHSVGQETVCTVLWHDGSSEWQWATNQSTPYKLTGSDLQYNDGTTLSTATSNRFVNYWLFVTADQTDPIWVIIGTAQYTTLAGALEEELPSFGELPSAEAKILWRLTYKSDGTPSFQQASDYRQVTNLPSVGVSSDHGALAGLGDDDHAQYLLADGSRNLSDATAPYLTLQNTTNENGQDGAETRIIFEDHSDTALAQIQGHHENTSDDTKGGLAFFTNTGSALTEAMRIDELQHVGIGGTAQSTAQLDVTDAADAVMQTRSGTRKTILSSHAEDWNYMQSYGAAFAFITKDSNAMHYYTNDTVAMSIDTSQRVGIGTTTPGTLLQLAKDGDAYLTLQNLTAENTDGGAETKIIFEDHANAALAQIQASHDGAADDTKGDLIFSTHTGSALTEALRIDSAQLATYAGEIQIALDKKIYFGDTAVHIQSDDDGRLDLTADTSIDINSNWTATGQTCADLGTVTTADIDGGTLDGVTIASDCTLTCADESADTTCFPVFVTANTGSAPKTGSNLTFNSSTGQLDSTLMTVGGGTGVSMSAASGVLTLAGIGGSNNENITIDFESTADYVIWNTGTSASTWWINQSLEFPDNVGIHLGSTFTDTGMLYDSANTNDSLQLGLTCGAAATSGYFSIMEYGDLQNANRDPGGTTANPTLRIYSADATSSTDYMEFFHDQTNANIKVAAGYCIVNTIYGTLALSYNGTEGFKLFADANLDQLCCATYDATGNQFVITNSAHFNQDHDHAAQTNPTLFIHSDTAPDTANTQWLGLYHDQTDAQILTGTGKLQLQSTAVGNVELFSATDVGDETDGKSLIIHRKAAEGDRTATILVDQWAQAIFKGSGATFLQSGDHLYFDTSGSKSMYFDAGDHYYFRDTDDSDAIRMQLNSADGTLTLNGTFTDGTLSVTGGAISSATTIDCDELFSNGADLKIQPDVGGDVILFGDTDVGDATDGKKLQVWRKAAEGDNYIDIYMDASKGGHMACTAGTAYLKLDSGNGYIFLESGAGQAMYFDCGADFYFRDEDDSNATRMTLTSSTGKLDINTTATCGGASFVIDQDDQDEPFIKYEGTSAADQTKSISTVNGDGSVEGPKNYSSSAGWAYEGMVRIDVNGTDYWMPYYSADTS